MQRRDHDDAAESREREADEREIVADRRERAEHYLRMVGLADFTGRDS